MKKDKKSIRGYGFSLAITLFKKRVEINFMPLVWNAVSLNVPNKIALAGAWHLNGGPFHVWGMGSDNLLAIEINFDYCWYWWDKPKTPHSHTRVF